MLVKSEAILLKKTPYSDNSAILHIFTRSHGVQAFIVQGLHGRSGKAAFLQPGNLLELVFYFQSNKNLKRIKEMQLMHGFRGYGQDPVRLQVLLFCTELSSKCLPDEQEDPATFDFLKSQFLDLAETTHLTWFPLQFLIHLAQICGLGLQLPEGEAAEMHLETTGTLFRHTGLNPLQYLDKEEIRVCRHLQNARIPEMNINDRRLLTEKLLYYFKVHLFPDSDLKSFPILMEVLG